MKKLNYILIILLSLLLVGVAFTFIRSWKIGQDTQRVIKLEQTASKDSPKIKKVKHLKKGKQDWYYLSPIEKADDFYVSNLPMSLYQGKQTDKAVIMVKPKLEASHIKQVNQLVIYKTVYKPQLFGLKKTTEKAVSRYHVKEDYSPFKLEELVAGRLDRIEEEAGKLYPGKEIKLSTDTMIEKNQVLSDGFAIDSGNLILLGHMSIPLASLFDVINPDFLEGSDKTAYDDYLEEKKAKEAEKEGQKLVALTFDDGPDPVTTPQVLDILAKYQAKGTFFMMGSKVVGHEALVKKVSAAGHDVENHSWDHPDLTTLTVDQIQTQINTTNQAIEKACGKRPVYLRPPYGATNDVVRRASGLKEMLWTVDTRDWENRNTAAIMANVKQQLQPGGVVLMHDIHQTSVDALPSIMEYLKAEGYKCVTLSELYGSR
ncbi:polysaccharide deacetylase [Streptococcus equi subsp. zooepidemicus Sz105]|uniref:polysaccharide deacetylase family protein n=1 Tax=Streptococcus equi TaxID=1336 RepID=UPI0005BDD0A9|nr:polysaccharide deacetylase family protein [Streptococcus equi]KIS13797.1 polysaccharide deacetylase [Streptococcus equi subsp. zooepidemicus Sz105]MDI5988188.1 polysaccharide deacetylase family protein [Streptococcus equi subsp. zooepidemicus]HEL0558107.1 polysaccharide deacetylase family protein [Streptococcus equi subsp. zooepidemicus]HEL0584755.1 polysaccharide deacetylase family protein [Streptococcus equi subsp. zooepidemicus]HEL0607982.1 polysaccharide deacetylase family protein [Stre